MKYITNRTAMPFPTKLVIRDVVKFPGERGVSVEEMDNRIRLLNVVRDTAEDATVIAFEDADHKALIDLLNAFRAGIIEEALLQIFKDIQTPSPTAA